MSGAVGHGRRSAGSDRGPQAAQAAQAPAAPTVEYSALYCSKLYKAKKIKRWLEGTLVHHPLSNKVVLKDDGRATIDSGFVRSHQTVEPDAELELDRYILTIDARLSGAAPAPAMLQPSAPSAPSAASVRSSAAPSAASAASNRPARPVARPIGLRASKSAKPLVELREPRSSSPAMQQQHQQHAAPGSLSPPRHSVKKRSMPHPQLHPYLAEQQPQRVQPQTHQQIQRLFDDEYEQPMPRQHQQYQHQHQQHHQHIQEVLPRQPQPTSKWDQFADSEQENDSGSDNDASRIHTTNQPADSGHGWKPAVRFDQEPPRAVIDEAVPWMSQADAYDTHADHQSFELPQDISFDQLDAFDFDEPGLDVQQLAHTGGDSNTVDGQSRNQASAMRSTQELLLMFGGDDEEQIPEDAHDLDASMSNANVHLQAGHHLQQTVGHQQQQHHQHVQKRLRIDDSQPCLDDDFAFNAQQIQGFTQPSPVNATQEQQSLPVSLFQPSQASEMSQMPSRAPQPALPPAVASKPVPRKQLSLPPLYFPDTNERIALAEQKLTRKGIMPATFDSKEEYRDTLSSLLMEHLQVMLHTIAVKLNQVVMSATTATNDAYLRHRGVPHYSNVKIRPFEVRDERAFRFQPALQARKNNHVLHLPSKEHSSAYSKGDLWVLSTSSTFDGCCIVRSFHYGPSANKTLEVVPMSPRDARMVQDLSRQNKSCFAIRAVNAGSELSMIQCISESLTACPITPALASPHRTIAAADGRNRPSQAAQRGGFKVPTITPKGLIVSSGLDLYHEILEGTVAEYHLNADQATVVRDFAASIADTRRHPVTLVHGVFGAGKSFLVGVVVIFLHRVRQSGLFVDGDRMRIAISSMTNVAVDLILLNLLDLGFTEFVRVGSLSKIAKPVLPYTAQAAKSPSDDIKELKSMLEDTTLTVSERREVQRAIQVFRANENKEAVAKAFVIGTTCLAATFDVLATTTCPIIILDECSQMTEPMSLIPITRFASDRALLVGDPYQLPPTVPSLLDGSPPTAVWPPPPPSPTNTPPHGLEWTLFERLADTSLVPIMLRTQYRCHPLIAQLSSTLFYESRLLNGVDAAQRPPLVPGLPPVSFMAVEAGCESSARGGSTANVVECTLVCDLAWQIIESGVDPSDVGIITLYKAQETMIAQRLAEQGEGHGIQVSTVDAYQGAEKLVIILSTVRTKSKGFIEDPRRINVALTRAKHHLVVVGDTRLLGTSRLWSKVLQHCVPLDRDPTDASAADHHITTESAAVDPLTADALGSVETLDLPGGAADTHTGQDDDYDVFDPAALDF